MKKEELILNSWPFEPLPTGVTVWPTVVGHLLGHGSTRRNATARAVALHFIVRGSGTFHSYAGDFEIESGDMFCTWPDVHHYFKEDPEDHWEFYWTRLNGQDTEDLAKKWGFSPDSPVHRPAAPGVVEQAFQALFEYWRRDIRDAHEGLALFFQLFAVSKKSELSKSGKEPRAPADIVLDSRIIIESLLETGINVNELAGMLRISRATLWRAFRKKTGKTVSKSVRDIRLEHACKLLKQTELTVAEVSRSCGFSDDKYFMRCFKNVMGRTPSEWRRKAKERER